MLTEKFRRIKIMNTITGEVVGIPVKINDNMFSVEVKTTDIPIAGSYFIIYMYPPSNFPITEIMSLTADGKVVIFSELLTWFHSSTATVQVHLKPIADLYDASIGGAFTRIEGKK